MGQKSVEGNYNFLTRQNKFKAKKKIHTHRDFHASEKSNKRRKNFVISGVKSEIQNETKIKEKKNATATTTTKT